MQFFLNGERVKVHPHKKKTLKTEEIYLPNIQLADAIKNKKYFMIEIIEKKGRLSFTRKCVFCVPFFKFGPKVQAQL